jgi:hypothetical protein
MKSYEALARLAIAATAVGVVVVCGWLKTPEPALACSERRYAVAGPSVIRTSTSVFPEKPLIDAEYSATSVRTESGGCGGQPSPGCGFAGVLFHVASSTGTLLQVTVGERSVFLPRDPDAPTFTTTPSELGTRPPFTAYCRFVRPDGAASEVATVQVGDN